MSALKLGSFGGMLPAWDERLLPDGQAAYARDCYMISGALIGWRQPKLLRYLNNSVAKFVFRVVNKDTNNTAITASDSKWLEFNDPDTNVMRTPVVQDRYLRHYAASPSFRPIYNTYDRIMDDDPWWWLGVPASGCTPGVTISGGGDTSQLGFQTLDPSFATTNTYVPGNTMLLVPIVPDGSMLLQDVAFIPQSTSATMNFRAVAYSDLNGRPYELLAQGGTGTGVAAGVQSTSVFQNGYAVISDTTYWIGIHSDEAYYVAVSEGNNRGVVSSSTFANGAPEFAGTATDCPTPQLWGDLIGSSVFSARGYVYTWVTEYGEEGPPSPPTVVNGWSNGTWRIELFTPPPEDMGINRNITKTRIYRTISSAQGLSTYFFVAEIPVNQAVYEDTRPDSEVALEMQLVSLYWFGPPEDLQGIAAFPNGITVGFRSNEVWFSEAYRPHAWPPGYVLTTEFPIVGIGVCGQAIVVCTQGMPYLINGINPSAMALTKINLPEPCLHRGSIVSTDTTVLYVSQNGLIQISQSGAGGNISEGWISRERWQELTPQRHVRAIKHTTSYFAFGNGVDGEPIRNGYTVELSQEDQVSFTVWPQPGGHRIGFGQLSSPNELDIENVEVDIWTGTAMLVQGGAIWYYDFTDMNPIIVPFKWRSKAFQQLSKKNFAAMRCWFSVPVTTPPQVDRNTMEPQPELGDNQYGIIRVYADGNLFTTRELRKSGELLRIYSGSAVELWQFELEGRVNVSNLQVATSVRELGLV
jgi:hypothetical protein